MDLLISQKMMQKLTSKHGVSRDEIIQCYSNREGSLLEDIREEHKTNPVTQWFIAETDFGRLLKIVFIVNTNGIVIKTAYVPNETEINIYNKHAY